MLKENSLPVDRLLHSSQDFSFFLKIFSEDFFFFFFNLDLEIESFGNKTESRLYLYRTRREGRRKECLR